MKKNDVREAVDRLAKACADMLIDKFNAQNIIGEGENDNLRVNVTINGFGCELGLTWNKKDEDEEESEDTDDLLGEDQ